MTVTWLARLFPNGFGSRKRYPEIPEKLWAAQLSALPFVATRSKATKDRLRRLCEGFLATKEFHGAHGLEVTDDMALSVAMQACLPLACMTPEPDTGSLLAWFDDFVGVVLHPGEVLATRSMIDDAGVFHQWQEPIAGEAMELGPVMLSWADVARAGATAPDGYNVVVHEFLHKMDLRDGVADGCPPLPAGFYDMHSSRAAREYWSTKMLSSFERFQDAVVRAQRFGEPLPWLDAYGAEAIDEFFAVTGEAYFVNRPRFTVEFPELLHLYDGLFPAAAHTDAQR